MLVIVFTSAQERRVFADQAVCLIHTPRFGGIFFSCECPFWVESRHDDHLKFVVVGNEASGPPDAGQRRDTPRHAQRVRIPLIAGAKDCARGGARALDRTN